MTSCLLPLFFLFSLCASIPTEPPGLKVRVTQDGLDVVKDFVIAFLKALENRPFPPIPIDIPGFKIKIDELTFTELDAKKENLVLTLKTGSLLIEIKDVPFHVHLQRKVNINFYNIKIHSAETDLTGDGANGELNLKMDLQLKRTEGGKLGVTMKECDAGKITMVTNSKLGWIIDSILSVGGYLKICDSLRIRVLPEVNSMLEKLPMKLPMVLEELNLFMDYSVSQDITVTPSGLNLPLKGLVYLEGQDVTANTEGADLDLGTDGEQMLYLGISDFFLNSYAASLYEGGALTKTWQKNLGLVDITARLSITEVPIIHIKPEKGICVTFQALSEELLTFSVECDIAVKVEVKGENLIAPLKDFKCVSLTTEPNMAKVTKPVPSPVTFLIKTVLNAILKKGVQIPLPPNIKLEQGTINYHDGFMVLAGSLVWTEDAVKTQVEKILNLVFPKVEGTEATSA